MDIPKIAFWVDLQKEEWLGFLNVDLIAKFGGVKQMETNVDGLSITHYIDIQAEIYQPSFITDIYCISHRRIPKAVKMMHVPI